MSHSNKHLRDKPVFVTLLLAACSHIFSWIYKQQELLAENLAYVGMMSSVSKASGFWLSSYFIKI